MSLPRAAVSTTLNPVAEFTGSPSSLSSSPYSSSETVSRDLGEDPIRHAPRR